VCHGLIFLLQLLTCEVLSGPAIGEHVFIPRIDIISNFGNICRWVRVQFPVRLSWGCTITKCQGQTLDFVGLLLKRALYQHGYLYVALSRVRGPNCIFVYMEPDQHQGVTTRGAFYTRNVVDRQLWDLRTDPHAPAQARPVAMPLPSIVVDDSEMDIYGEPEEQAVSF